MLLRQGEKIVERVVDDVPLSLGMSQAPLVYACLLTSVPNVLFVVTASSLSCSLQCVFQSGRKLSLVPVL